MSLRVVAIAGASGSGKSFFADALHAELSRHRPDRSAIIQEDSYYRHAPQLSFAERCRVNYDHPNAFEHDLLANHVAALRNGEAVDVPTYDFSTHLRTARTKRITLPPVDDDTRSPAFVLIVEGILLLHSLPHIADLRVFIDTPPAVCLQRRISRDSANSALGRGRSVSSVMQQYVSTVRPMSRRYIFPSRQSADMTIDGTGDVQQIARMLANGIGN